MGAVLSVVVAIGVPLGISLAINYKTPHDTKGWYKDLKKPSWTPPAWVFGPAWTILYSLMGTASWLVWKNGTSYIPLTLYGVQLMLNFAWSPLFFGKKDPGLALADIIGLLGVLTATIVEFRKVDEVAAALMYPYLGWTAFASALTYNIWANNTVQDGKVAPKLTPEEAQEEAQAAANKELLDRAESLAAKPLV